ncbi:peptidylprolyl isomerase [Hydrogenivirga sp.]
MFFGLSFAQLLDRVVANVNGEPILESELKVAEMFYGIHDRDRLISLLVEKHLIAQFLKEQGLNVPDDYIENLIRDIAKSNKKSVEELYRDLYKENLSPEDLRNFLRVEVASNLGLGEYLRSRVKVSEVEIELEKLKKGDIKYLKEVELLVVDKKDKEKLLKLVGRYGEDIEKIAKEMGYQVERLKVGRGELVENLDREIWRAKRGQLAVAEDGDNIYLAKVLRDVRIISGRSEDEIKEELLSKKLEDEKAKLVEKLKNSSLIEIYG